MAPPRTAQFSAAKATSHGQMIEPHWNQLEEARVKDDDWTGKADPAERRRRQNRLHQRAWRRRRDLLRAAKSGPLPGEVIQLGIEALPLPRSDHPENTSLLRKDQYHDFDNQLVSVDFGTLEGRNALWAALEPMGEPQATLAYWAQLSRFRKGQITFAQSTDGFSLSADHQLFVLIQHNVIRGIMTNMCNIMRLSGLPFKGMETFDAEIISADISKAPIALLPTPLQLSVRHEAWIDVLPYPAMRDTIIQSQDWLDLDDLCADFVGGMYEGDSDISDRGFVLWGEPWAEDGWEMSDEFAKKWWFLLRGCGSLVKSTNRWRKARGAAPLPLGPAQLKLLDCNDV